MTANLRPLLLLFIAILCILSCKKVDIAGDTGSQGRPGPTGDSAVSGSVNGRVKLYDTLGNPILDNSGASVIFENSSDVLNLNTGIDGSFSGSSLLSGRYDITVSKTGFGSMKIFGFEESGGVNTGQTGIIEMGQKLSSWFDIRNLKIDTVTSNQFRYMYLTITLSHPQQLPNAEVLLFVGHASGVDNGNNDYVFRTNFTQLDDSTLVYSPFDTRLSVYSDNLNGDFLYFSAALDNPKPFTYTDSSGNTFYPAAGKTSNAVVVYNNLKN